MLAIRAPEAPCSAGESQIGQKSHAIANSIASAPPSHRLIPGGSHTYAKGDDQYPVLAPGFIVKGDGCHVWDVDGNEFIEYGMGLRAVSNRGTVP